MRTASELKEEGNDFYRKREYQNALESYQKAIEIDPCYKEAWFNGGMCYMQLEQTSKAMECFEEALKIDPNYEKPHFHLNKLKLPAHILFGIVDLKFTEDEQVKLLEFGEGINSNFLGYDRLYSSNDNTKKMLNLFKKELSQYSILEATLPDAIRSSGNVHVLTPPSRELKDYSTILIPLHSKEKITKSAKYLSKNILILDGSVSWQMVAGNKYVMHQLVDTGWYSKYRPRCKAYPARYEDSLAEKIKKSIPTEIYVLKAPNLSKGEGVIIVNANDLDRVLRDLLCDDGNQPKEYKDWLSKGPQIFLVEEYCQSKEFKLGNQRYDPTMRVAFIITVDKGCATFKPLGCYWKLPKEPLNSKGMLKDRMVSQITEQGLGSAKVSSEEEKKVYKQLASFLPALFLDILCTDPNKMIDDLKNNRDDLVKAYAYVLQLSCLVISYRLEEKWWSICKKKEIPVSTKQLKKIEGGKFHYYNEKGLFYSLFGDYPKAIQQYNKSLQQDPANACTFFLRSLAYKMEKNEQKEVADYKTYQQLAKSAR